MATAFKSDRHARVFGSVVTELKKLGYAGELLQQDYRFGDWFLQDRPQRTAPAAAFGRTPLSYDSACFAVLVPNGLAGGALVNEYRALGAPFALEVGEQEVNVWPVGQAAQAPRPWLTIPVDGVPRAFKAHAADWTADSVLRAKNISDQTRSRQLDFIDLGLIPALEEQIRGRLDELLNEVLSKTERVYRRKTREKADEKLLFRLVFRLFAAKVLHDREVAEFATFAVADGPARILRAVGKFYQQHEDVLDQPDAQATALELLWDRVNFQNLSVEVLAYIYENTLVSQSSRRRLGTHSTPSSVARYLIGRLPFEDYPQNHRVVVEPCSGHAVLLVAAMHRLRELLPPTMDPVKRHQYLVQMLHGFEIDTFALEVGKLCMMLADFPNANGWKLENKDVFASRLFTDSLRDARFVVCNPPFEDFDETDRERYKGLASVHRPAELITRVLDNLHPKGCLGFVLPRHVLDGTGYRTVRERLARRFREVEVVALPDDVFHVSRSETALVVAKSPEASFDKVSVSFAVVRDTDRGAFLRNHRVTRQDVRRRTSADVTESLIVPPLWEVWQHLRTRPTLSQFAECHRGIEWKKYDDQVCHAATPRKGYRRGYLNVDGQMISYQPIRPVYLNVDPANLLWSAIDWPWEQPHVVVNAARNSRGAWRVTGFVDRSGNLCTQRFIGVWPTTPTVSVEVLTAVLNGPVANAFVMASERGRDNRIRTLDAIPMPNLTAEAAAQITALVREYEQSAGGAVAGSEAERSLRPILLEIDALVLGGYALPPRLERSVLEYFADQERPVPFDFSSYEIESFAAVRAVGGGSGVTDRLADARKRRTALAGRLIDGTLTPAEDDELASLDRSLDRYVDTVSPLPFDVLERLEGEARRRGVLTGKDD